MKNGSEILEIKNYYTAQHYQPLIKAMYYQEPVINQHHISYKLSEKVSLDVQKGYT